MKDKGHGGRRWGKQTVLYSTNRPKQKETGSRDQNQELRTPQKGRSQAGPKSMPGLGWGTQDWDSLFTGTKQPLKGSYKD